MKLVMFDMDGTLTDGFAIEENCYVLAIERALNLRNVKAEWETYVHTTASFCLEEIVRRARGHPPTVAESQAVQACMVGLMADITRRTGRHTREIPGAAACIRELQRRGYAVAIASGDWEATARLKFITASIPFEGLPSAFCDVATPRIDIMRAALDRAEVQYGCKRFDRVTYVGDAVWDVHACRALGWPLVGIAAGRFSNRLPEHGVTHMVPHYLDFDAFLAAIEQAEIPRTIPA